MGSLVDRPLSNTLGNPGRCASGSRRGACWTSLGAIGTLDAGQVAQGLLTVAQIVQVTRES